MKTTATNRKLRELLTSIKQKKLVPNPAFQRRLVWGNKHKVAFIKTVLDGLPFPEIYIASGSVDLETGEGYEMLVDGQQRITTLYQYFHNIGEIKYSEDVRPYIELKENERLDFLEYEVVVRDLGSKSIEEIKEVFRRINSTKYSLNAMELHNARYDGEFKLFGDVLSQNSFFEHHSIFTSTDVRRMQDMRFVLTAAISVMSSYFTRDDELENYLQKYNDDFPDSAKLKTEFEEVFKFIDACSFDPKSRVWNKADLFSLLVELYKQKIHKSHILRVEDVSSLLTAFYYEVDNSEKVRYPSSQAVRYYRAAIQGSNDRVNRITRGQITNGLLTLVSDLEKWVNLHSLKDVGVDGSWERVAIAADSNGAEITVPIPAILKDNIAITPKISILKNDENSNVYDGTIKRVYNWAQKILIEEFSDFESIVDETVQRKIDRSKIGAYLPWLEETSLRILNASWIKGVVNIYGFTELDGMVPIVPSAIPVLIKGSFGISTLDNYSALEIIEDNVGKYCLFHIPSRKFIFSCNHIEQAISLGNSLYDVNVDWYYCSHVKVFQKFGNRDNNPVYNDTMRSIAESNQLNIISGFEMPRFKI